MALKSLFSKGGKDSKDVLPPPKRTSGDDTTLAPSGAVSLRDEKMEPITTATRPESAVSPPAEMNDAEKKIAGIQQDEEEKEEDESEYPKAGALTLITTALCLSIFCMALDNTIISTAVSPPSLPPLRTNADPCNHRSRRSQMSSKVSEMLDGKNI